MRHALQVLFVCLLTLSVGAISCSTDDPVAGNNGDNNGITEEDARDGSPDAAPDSGPDVGEDADADDRSDTSDGGDDTTEAVDSDDDGYPDDEDAFPNDPDEWADSDGDGVGDNADACPANPDGTTDSDQDGVCDTEDAFPNDPDEQYDIDGDGVGNNADEDDDGDGLSDVEETEWGSDCLKSNPQVADSDGDGIDDAEDPYPLEAFPEFILRNSDQNAIDLFLSNRDGTFQSPVEIGSPIDHQGTPLSYGRYSIGDFDTNGEIDFIAHSSPLVDGSPTRNLYFFWRDSKADEFLQTHIGTTDEVIAGTVMDANGDNRFDVVRFETERPNYISTGQIVVYLNNDAGAAAPCVASDNASDNCFFVRQPPIDVTSTVDGEWKALMARQAVNLNPGDDDHPDLTLATYSSGGNAATQIYTLFGNGDGTFQQPTLQFTHNDSGQQAPANTLLFADFNNDGIGDVSMGFDDDGRPGEAWTYFGDGSGGYDTTPVVAVDLNPNDDSEISGGESLGRTGSGRTFDFDFDGNMDLIVGYDHENYGDPGQTRLYMGNGDGTFDDQFSVIGPTTLARHRFQLPQRLCSAYQFINP